MPRFTQTAPFQPHSIGRPPGGPPAVPWPPRRRRLHLHARVGLLALVLAASAVSQEVVIYRGPGAWPVEGSRALPALLEHLGISYAWIGPGDIRSGRLRRNGRPRHRLLVFPGGWAPAYLQALGGSAGAGRADDEIRAFVAAGGGYLGFCAGAFAASTTVRWAGRTYRYPWRLFLGTAEGPLRWNPLHNGALGAVHGTAVPDRQAAEFRTSPHRIRVLLYGGPRFILAQPRRPPPGFRILLRHGEDHSAAAVFFRYPGARGGRVLLCAFHPAVLTSDGGAFDRDPATLVHAGAGRDPDGPGPDWALAAALVRIALGFPPRPFSALPRVDLRLALPPFLLLGARNTLHLTQTGAAGRIYVLAASTAPVPGIRLGPGLVLPLQPSSLLSTSLGTPGLFDGFVGRLNALGQASAALNVPALPALRGTRWFFAGAVLGPRTWISVSPPRSAVFR